MMYWIDILVDANGQLVHVMNETIREEILDAFKKKRILKEVLC